VGTADGSAVGDAVGKADGSAVGEAVGTADGTAVGNAVGSRDGAAVVSRMITDPATPTETVRLYDTLAKVAPFAEPL
jgi:hypothetical protein